MTRDEQLVVMCPYCGIQSLVEAEHECGDAYVCLLRDDIGKLHGIIVTRPMNDNGTHTEAA